MVEQQGQVLSVSDDRVRVRLGGASGCPACEAGEGCGAGIFGRLLRRRPVVLEFDNAVGAAPGQAVVVGMPESLFLSLVTRLYLLPLLAALGGASIGHYVSVRLQSGPRIADLAALACAVLAAGIALVRARRQDRREFPDESAVHLLRTAGGAGQAACRQDKPGVAGDRQ